MGYLPTKNFIAPVSAILVVLFTGWFVVRVIWKQNPENILSTAGINLEESKLLAMDKALEKTSLDSDGDGLKDWEEALWKTDPTKKDTDGDGTNDADEIQDGRDPTISELNADDVFKKPEDFAKSNGTTTKTISQKAADEFALNYFTAKARLKGGALSNAAKQKLVINLLLAMQKGASAYKDRYNQKDVKTSKTADAKDYLNKLGGTLDENFKEITEPEIDIMNKMSDIGDFSGVVVLDTYIPAYQKTIKFLESEIVPESYAALHLALLNSMNNTLIAVEGFRHVEDDPVRGFIGLQMYYKEIYDARQYMIALKKQTDADKIAFNGEDDGSFFNQYFIRVDEIRKNEIKENEQ